MAVYFVTGKLGSGKSLIAVSKIRERLAAGRPVATNLDLKLINMCGPKAKTPVVYRLPDKPSIADFEVIGRGNDTYDESKNGLVVLDECGTWFNSRTWGDKERQAIINWFLHARKSGWDLLFIVQNIQVVDKQARLTLAEHVVYCRRLDKLTIPFVSSISRIFTNNPIRLPKLHVTAVKYGDEQNALRVERWVYWGTDLYSSYDTKQAFSDFYEHGTYQMLTPWLVRGRYMVPMTWGNIMRMTKIHWKRYSRPIIAGAFFALGVGLAIALREPPPAPEPVVIESPAAPETEDAGQGVATGFSLPSSKPADPEPAKLPVQAEYGDWIISGYLSMGGRSAYTLSGPDGRTRSLDAVAKTSVDILPRDNCHIRLISKTDLADFVDLYAPSCIPESSRPVVANAIDVIPDSYERSRVLAWPSVVGYQGSEPDSKPIAQLTSVQQNSDHATRLRVTGLTNTKGALQ